MKKFIAAAIIALTATSAQALELKASYDCGNTTLVVYETGYNRYIIDEYHGFNKKFTYDAIRDIFTDGYIFEIKSFFGSRINAILLEHGTLLWDGVKVEKCRKI